jgi:arginase family enzyme
MTQKNNKDSLLRQPVIRFYGAESWKPNQNYDITFLGIPTSIGMYGGSKSTASAPGAMRSASRLLPSIFDTNGMGIGWYDYSQSRSILVSRRLADAGDLIINRHSPLTQLELIPEKLSLLKENSKLVIILGGDHSLTYWTTRPFNSSKRHLLFIDAHEDATDIIGDLPHSGNVISFIERDHELSVILQYGLRGLVPNQRRDTTSERHLCSNVKELSSMVQCYCSDPMHLSIDIDVIDPKIISSVAAPSPIGMTPGELLTAVHAARQAGAQIDMLELMEFAPVSGDDGLLDAFTLVQLLLRLAHTCLEEP